mmetsp:Transcript_20210/g.26158  ORF Transcript_20210/g.26158 Transcript_20210/m.26158 type:complete len:414 (+) Transcript_20210:43-1284(+)
MLSRGPQTFGVVLILIIVIGWPCLRDGIIQDDPFTSVITGEEAYAVSCKQDSNKIENCHEYQVQPQAMCDASGKCGEDSRMATVRTAYSAIKHRPKGSWLAQHELNKEKAADFVKSELFSKNEKPLLILLGDSIFESFLGTSMKMQVERAAGCPQVLRESFGQTFSTLPLAVSGDQTQHLLWRLPRELPQDIRKADNVIFLVLIGTNNLGVGLLPESTFQGIMTIISWLLTNTKGSILLLGILPRGDRWLLSRLCPPRCSSFGKNNKPFNSFLPAIHKVNQKLKSDQQKALSAISDASSRVEFIHHCGDRIFSPVEMKMRRRISRFFAGGAAREVHDNEALAAFEEQQSALLQHNPDVYLNLMPDALHPNAAGHQALAECLLNSSRLLATNSIFGSQATTTNYNNKTGKYRRR